jgi:hypothetical protein
MFWALVFVTLTIQEPHFCFDTKWEGRFAFTGQYPYQFRNKRGQRIKEHIIVVQPCLPVWGEQNRIEYENFCKYAGGITGRPELCFTTGLITSHQQCEKIMSENMRRYRRIGVVINYELSYFFDFQLCY